MKKSLRARAIVAASGVLLFACGSSKEAELPSGDGASGPTPAAAPGAPAPAIDPAATDPAATADQGQVSGEGADPAVATPSGEEIGGDLPIAGADDGEPAAVSSENGGTGDGDGSGEPIPAEGSTDAEGSPSETPTAPSEPTTPGETTTPAENVELSPITIWIAGDSTVANGNTPCPRGWGGAFAPHFSDLVTVNNAAVGGRSVHTWLYNVQTVMDATGECALTRDASGQPTLQPRWQTMLDGMKAGDYLFIQFGINDGDRTCDRHVGIDAFTTAYGMMADAAKARGAHPIFLTPVSSIACNGATARGSRGEFVPATLRAGTEFDVPVIDLHERSVALFQERGFCPVAGGDVSAATTGPVGDFFCDDHTHFSSAGAVVIADVVVQALVDQQIPLAAYLR